MILPIVKYGHPVLRKKGVAIERIDTEIAALIEDMFETMHAAAGVGLAAQQVGRALQLTVIDVRAVKDRPSTVQVDGKPVPIADFMPLVLINPQVKPAGDAQATGPEGCLSFPEIYEDIPRFESVAVSALNRHGEKFSFTAGGLLARAVQHEVDHLNGILFIDRMTAKDKQAIKADLETLQAETKRHLKAASDT
ncbi:MAG: peptide deformylase [Verrucomicrobiota bacterium]|jgi:peptide deformylase